MKIEFEIQMMENSRGKHFGRLFYGDDGNYMDSILSDLCDTEEDVIKNLRAKINVAIYRYKEIFE